MAYLPTARDVMIKEALINMCLRILRWLSLSRTHLIRRHYRQGIILSFSPGVSETAKVPEYDGLHKDRGLFRLPRLEWQAVWVDYLVLDLKGPWFVGDKGCEWIYGECRSKETGKKFLDCVAYTRSTYDTVVEQDSFMILRRRGA